MARVRCLSCWFPHALTVFLGLLPSVALAWVEGIAGAHTRTDSVRITWSACSLHAESGVLYLILPPDSVGTAHAFWATTPPVITISGLRDTLMVIRSDTLERVQHRGNRLHAVQLSNTRDRARPLRFSVQIEFAQRQVIDLSSSSKLNREDHADTIDYRHHELGDVPAKARNGILRDISACAGRFRGRGTSLDGVLRYVNFRLGALRYHASNVVRPAYDLWARDSGDCDDFVRAANDLLQHHTWPCRLVLGIPTSDDPPMRSRPAEQYDRSWFHAIGEVQTDRGWLQYEPGRSDNFATAFVRLATGARGTVPTLLGFYGGVAGDFTWSLTAIPEVGDVPKLRRTTGVVTCGAQDRGLYCREGTCPSGCPERCP